MWDSDVMGFSLLCGFVVGNQPVNTVYQFDEFVFFGASHDYTGEEMAYGKQLFQGHRTRQGITSGL